MAAGLEGCLREGRLEGGATAQRLLLPIAHDPLGLLS